MDTRKHKYQQTASDSLSIDPLEDVHLLEVCEIWQSQYREEIASASVAPASWLTDMSSYNSFVSEHIRTKNGIVARLNDQIVGYMIHDAFEFHDERTAFCPIMGHGARKSYRKVSYEKMYQHMSEQWIAEGCLNHMVTFFAHDELLRDLLFHLGFGLYVVDAFRLATSIRTSDADVNIIQADVRHADDVMRLGEESHSYYLQAPLFLVRDPYDMGYYTELLANDAIAIFVAYVSDSAVGLMNVRRDNERDTITLCDSSTGLLDPIGAYIRDEYRGRGIGNDLLQRSIQWCQNQGLERIHVDFESANLLGNRFWLKHFTPVMDSVKRRVFQDAMGDQR